MTPAYDELHALAQVYESPACDMDMCSVGKRCIWSLWHTITLANLIVALLSNVGCNMYGPTLLEAWISEMRFAQGVALLFSCSSVLLFSCSSVLAVIGLINRLSLNEAWSAFICASQNCTPWL